MHQMSSLLIGFGQTGPQSLLLLGLIRHDAQQPRLLYTRPPFLLEAVISDRYYGPVALRADIPEFAPAQARLPMNPRLKKG